MKLSRRKLLHLAAGAAAMPAASRIARAQAYPTRQVRWIVGFSAGGLSDIVARLMAQWLTARLGQPFLVENRPGAATNIATEFVVRAPADGYTLLMATPANATSAAFYNNLNFNFIHDIAAVAGIIRAANVMAVHPSVPATSVPEFIAYAKANPGKLNFASAGNGTNVHLIGELFKLRTGLNLVHVPYRGSAPALTDMISGRVQLMFDNLPSSIEPAGRQAACAGRDHRDTLSGIAGHPDHGRFHTGLRGQRLAGSRRSQEHAARNYREAQHGDQCCPRRSDDEGAACEAEQYGACTLARRVRCTHRRRNREMGSRDPGG